MADMPMACWSTTGRNLFVPDSRGVVDYRRAPHPPGFFRTLRFSRPRYACAGLSNTPSSRQRSISICAKSYVCGGCMVDSRAGVVFWRCRCS